METIMIVDDDQYSHDFYHEMLEGTEYKVLSAYDGKEGLSILERNRPVLVVIDYTLFQNMGLTVSGTQEEYSGCIENIPVIISPYFSIQVRLVQTFLAKRTNFVRETKFAYESQEP